MLITYDDFRRWQIDHYSQRLTEESAAEEQNVKAKIFLRLRLYTLMKQKN
jgi:hypothetical protein